MKCVGSSSLPKRTGISINLRQIDPCWNLLLVNLGCKLLHVGRSRLVRLHVEGCSAHLPHIFFRSHEPSLFFPLCRKLYQNPAAENTDGLINDIQRPMNIDP